ncbi:MAG TPA: DinB family protein [Gemmatimonadaceae bacterium]|nr:DinB family protein [Gemmatimonadaceae bacterium]
MTQSRQEPRTATPKETYLATYERECGITMRVLRAYPTERLDLRPHAKCKSARELGWVFVAECMLGVMVFNDVFIEQMSSGDAPQAPESWDEILATLERAQVEFAELVRSTPDEELVRKVRFFTAPKTMGEVTRMEWLWFLLHDQIHHRGQFSIYLRMADGTVPSIYGPTADEPWM